MRYAIAVLSVITAASTGACTATPGVPMTDVTAASTQLTGEYDVVQRTVEGKRYTLRVDAMRPDCADVIAEHLVQQLLTFSPDEVVVDVRPHQGVQGQSRTIRWTRGKDVSAASVSPSPPHEGTAPGDRLGARATGQSGTAH